jgi:hypothetical protein
MRRLMPQQLTRRVSGNRFMSYSVAQAAKAVGKSKATVLRAIQAGRISAARDDAGAFRVEPIELHRVFPPLPHEAAHEAAADASRSGDAAGEAREIRARLEAAEAAIRFRDEIIIDLRQQRDRVQEQLTAALRITDQRANGVAVGNPDQRANGAAVPDSPRSPWRRFLAWRARP